MAWKLYNVILRKSFVINANQLILKDDDYNFHARSRRPAVPSFRCDSNHERRRGVVFFCFESVSPAADRLHRPAPIVGPGIMRFHLRILIKRNSRPADHPAIATTTAAVTGLVVLEMFKIFKDKPATDLRTRQVGLALNYYPF